MTVNINNEFAENISEVNSSLKDESENIYILAEGESGNYFYKISESGETIIKKKLGDYYYETIYVDDSIIYFLGREKQNPEYFLEKFDIGDGEFIGKINISGYTNMQMQNGILFSYKLGKVCVFDLTGNLTREILIPGERESTDIISSSNGDIYYLNKKGVFCTENNQETFSLILDTKSSEIFDDYDKIDNFYVESNSNIYIHLNFSESDRQLYCFSM